MKAFGNIELTTTELPDKLEFRVDSELGWFGPVILFLLGVACVIWALTMEFIGLIVALGLLGLAEIVFVGIWAVRSWKRVDTTLLSVTRESFVATGCGIGTGFSRNSSITVPASEVKRIQYVNGGDNMASGLYVSTGYWKSKCVLPGLNRQRCTAIIVAIVRRFPEIGAQLNAKL